METEKRNLYSRYKQDADASKHGYYGYELWLEKKLIEAESELKKLRIGDVSGRSEQFVCLCPRNETDNCDRKVPCKECETCPHLRQTNFH